MTKRLNVYFTCPTDLIVENYDLYVSLIKHIRLNNAHITYDWVENAYVDLKNNNKQDEDFNNLKNNGIEESDIVIAEMSAKSIGVIHQITIALQKTKPTLLLRPYLKSSQPIEAIKSNWFVEKQYKDVNNAKLLISEFLKTYSSDKKIRLHLVITAYENIYLSKEMKKQGISKTEIIRNLIKSEADRPKDK